MKLINKCDGFSDKELHKIIDFVDPGVSKNTKVYTYASRTSPAGFSFYRPKREIEVDIPTQLKFPWFWNKMSKSRVDILLLSLEEMVVFIIAHELRHQWQYRRPPVGEWSYGCRHPKKRRSHHHHELDADHYAVKKLRQWRKQYQPREIYRDVG